MRSRNREINIFNMSLLDILTGMLGAFLFLMLGMMPYYAKVSKLKDSVSADEAQKMRDTIAAQTKQIAGLQKQIEDLKNQLAQQSGDPEAFKKLQQQVEELTKDRDYWKRNQRSISLISEWGDANTDIDVLMMDGEGNFYSPKAKDKVLGKDAVFDGDDSHANGNKVPHEGLIILLPDSGDYMIFYRVPPNARPQDYAGLTGYYLYQEALGKEQGLTLMENILPAAHAQWAKPGGYYAWVALHYDADKNQVTIKKADAVKWPKGIVIPQEPPPTPAPTAPPAVPFPFRTPFRQVPPHTPVPAATASSPSPSGTASVPTPPPTGF